MARCKARGRLPISANSTFLASYHGLGTMSRYWSKLRCLKEGGSLWRQISGGKWASPTNDFWHQKSRVPGLSYGEKIAEKFNRLSRVHQRHRQQTTDRQTDRRQTDGRWHIANVNVSVTFAKNGRFKKSLVLAPDQRSDCKCCKMITFLCPTSWRPEQLAYLRTSKLRHCQSIYTGPSPTLLHECLLNIFSVSLMVCFKWFLFNFLLVAYTRSLQWCSRLRLACL